MVRVLLRLLIHPHSGPNLQKSGYLLSHHFTAKKRDHLKKSSLDFQPTLFPVCYLLPLCIILIRSDGESKNPLLSILLKNIFICYTKEEIFQKRPQVQTEVSRSTDRCSASLRRLRWTLSPLGPSHNFINPGTNS